jgi:hypothetical protein
MGLKKRKRENVYNTYVFALNPTEGEKLDLLNSAFCYGSAGVYVRFDNMPCEFPRPMTARKVYPTISVTNGASGSKRHATINR